MCLGILIYNSLQQKVNLLNSNEVQETRFKLPWSQMKTKIILFETWKDKHYIKKFFCMELKGKGRDGLQPVISKPGIGWVIMPQQTSDSETYRKLNPKLKSGKQNKEPWHNVIILKRQVLHHGLTQQGEWHMKMCYSNLMHCKTHLQPFYKSEKHRSVVLRI